MKTFDPIHVYMSPTEESLPELANRVRRLWSERLHAGPDEREELITSLQEVDIAIERLSVRSACGLFESADHADIEQCRQRVEELERRWQMSRNQSNSARLKAA